MYHVAKAEASQKQKASTFGAALSHVAKLLRLKDFMMILKLLLLSQETPGDLTTIDRLSPKVKMFLIPVIGRYRQRFKASKVLDYLSRTVASYTDVVEVILKDIDNDDDYHEVRSMMDLVLGCKA
ncbi:hypothetical protein Tco_1151875, partial [Tanacetum coccineum]